MNTLIAGNAGRRFNNSDAWWNTVLLESANFVVVPSLVSIVSGWLLVTPKEPCLSMSRLHSSVREECNELINQARNSVRALFGPVLLFEHGPHRKGSSTGCSVDQAHMHVVPCCVRSIDDVISLDVSETCWVEVEQRHFFNVGDLGLSYLYVEFDDGRAFCTSAREFVSQQLRRVVARSAGIEDQYDWRAYPQYANIETTLAKFGRLPQNGLGYRHLKLVDGRTEWNRNIVRSNK